jgi:RNA polymerase sigma-70 factor (ECF subfamily)
VQTVSRDREERERVAKGEGTLDACEEVTPIVSSDNHTMSYGRPAETPLFRGDPAVSNSAPANVADLYEEFHRPLIAYLRACDQRAYEDLAADTWLKVMAGLATFDGDKSAFRAWLFTIARHRLIDHRRQLHRRGTPIDLDALPARSSRDDPEREAMSAIANEAALRMIGTLPPDQADAVLLRVIADLGTAEVAAIMGKRTGTVRVLQHRALRRLAEILNRDM